MADLSPTSSTAKPKTRTFKPRAGIVRKSQAERDAHAKQEAEKAATRAAAAVQAAGKPSQPLRTAASKKRESIRDRRDSSQSVAGAVFGASTDERQGWKRTTYDSGHSEMLEGQEGVKPKDGPSLQGQGNLTVGERQQGASGGGGRSSRQTRDGPAFESDDEPDETRRDIETIWISSSEEQDEPIPTTGKGKARALQQGRRSLHGGGLRPVRAARAVSEEQSSEDDKQTIKSTRTLDDGDSMEVNDEMTADAPRVKQDIPSSPEISRRGKPGRKLGARAKDGKSATETVEERAERRRLREDVDKLGRVFTTLSKVKQDEDSIEVDDESMSDRKLFLFQFPPLIPLLIDETQGTDGQQADVSGPTIKTDPDGPPVATSTANEDKPVSMSTQPKTQIEGILTANEPYRFPTGRVGKLRIHKSGKVTLDWGGTNMEVRYGTEVDFLQDAVLVEPPFQASEGGDKDSTTQSGLTYALGQVRKKMIVIPDWQKLYD